MNSSNNTPDNTHKFGQLTLFLFWVAMIGLGTYALYVYDEKKKSPTSELGQNGERRVALTSSHHGHYIANGKINGVEVTFMLDTGASGVSVPVHIAEKIGLRKGHEAYSSTANGTIKVYNTSLNTVSLGDIQLRNVSGSINPHMDDDEVLLGMTFLRRLEWQQKDGTLVLIQ